MPDPLPFDPIGEARRHWTERWGPEPARPMTAVTNVMRVQQILLAELNLRLRKHGLTFPRYEALMVLLFTKNGSIPLGKLGKRLQVHRTSVTNIIDKLERDGLVRRVPHDSDRRATLATITGEGRALAKAATEELNAAAFALSGLAPDQEEQLSDLLELVRRTAGDFSAEPTRSSRSPDG